MARVNPRRDSSLPPALDDTVGELLMASMGPSSRKQYAKDMMKFEQFCIVCLGIDDWFPASVSTLAGFIAHLFREGYASSTIQSTMSAISYFHKLLGVPDTVSDFVIQKLVLGTKRARPSVDLRAPVSKDLLGQLIASSRSVVEDNYTLHMFKAMLSLAYFALLRVSEVVAAPTHHTDHRLKMQDVVISQTELVIVFRSYKHSQPGKSFTLAVPRQSPKSICPVHLVKRFVKERGPASGPLFVFPGAEEPSPSWFKSTLRDTVAAAGLSDQHITSHSFRIGRVRDMAIAGYSSTEIRLAGRWRSDAFQKYMRVSAVAV